MSIIIVKGVIHKGNEVHLSRDGVIHGPARFVIKDGGILLDFTEQPASGTPVGEAAG